MIKFKVSWTERIIIIRIKKDREKYKTFSNDDNIKIKGKKFLN